MSDNLSREGQAKSKAGGLRVYMSRNEHLIDIYTETRVYLGPNENNFCQKLVFTAPKEYYKIYTDRLQTLHGTTSLDKVAATLNNRYVGY